ncbi:MAG: hypothetical protein OXD01_11010 [Gammaproteobacteria bacterium]|nr:hypothetical protein [Gammaproteobacteria bacterium]
MGGGDITTAGSAARRYTTAVIEGVPVQDLGVLKSASCQALIKHVLSAKLIELSFDETSADFRNHFVLREGDSLRDITKSIKQEILCAKEKALYATFEIDKLVTDSFNLEPLELEFIDSEVGVHPCIYSGSPNQDQFEILIYLEEESLINSAVEFHGSKRYFTKKSFFVDRRIEVLSHYLQASPAEIIALLRNIVTDSEEKEAACSILSECVGIAFRRWSKMAGSDELREPFTALPNIAPAGLAPNSENASSQSDSHEGILVVDEGCQFDLCSVIKSEIQLLKPGTLLDECINAVGGKNLANYFTNPNLFFSDHLSRYSKSRRQAPIYWPLQTSSGSYTLWIYYHRLNEQTLYTCVNDFVEPKLQQTEQDLSILQGKSSRTSSEEKDLEMLIDLVNELHEFRDELLRIAKLWKPNLNDGIQITAAPLWKLFQHKSWQKKLKETWVKLEKGDYDWAHLAFSIWPNRVLGKCHQDRSLAIAHNVENILWHEVEVPVKRGKKATGGTKLEWQPKELSEAELEALIQSQIKEDNA